MGSIVSGRPVPTRGRDALPLGVQSPKRRDGKERQGNDRLAHSGDEQFRLGGAAALERHAGSPTADAGPTLALAAAP